MQPNTRPRPHPFVLAFERHELDSSEPVDKPNSYTHILFDFRTRIDRMETIEQEKEADFDSKTDDLCTALRDWYVEEAEAIDADIVNDAPSGEGGSIISKTPAIDSKRVLDASSVTKEILRIEIPPEIIKPGGYETCDEMLADLLPKLRDVYSGKLKVKDRQARKEMVEV